MCRVRVKVGDILRFGPRPEGCPRVGGSGRSSRRPPLTRPPPRRREPGPATYRKSQRLGHLRTKARRCASNWNLIVPSHSAAMAANACGREPGSSSQTTAGQGSKAQPSRRTKLGCTSLHPSSASDTSCLAKTYMAYAAHTLQPLKSAKILKACA